MCHCLLIETPGHGLVLVDTGFGLQDVRHPHDPPARMTRFMRHLINVRLREEETAIRQIERLGFDPGEVRQIVLTHMDFDHAGGLEDFPKATIHVLDREFSAATGPQRGFFARNRYRPAQWDALDNWRRYSGQGEPWFGFEAVRDLEGLPPEILLVPLPGHTWGHAGVAVQHEAGWMLHAGDAYFYHGEMRHSQRRCTPGLRLYQTLLDTSREDRLANQARLRALSVERADEVRLFCAHDTLEFERWASGQPL